jgi:hypothetical protein
MAIPVDVAGSAFDVWEEGESNWGGGTTDLLVAICENALWGSGGVVDYLVSETANPAQSGIFRQAHTDGIGWRNFANDGDLLLKPDATTDVLEWDGDALALADDVIPLVSPVTTGNLVKQKAGGDLEDAGISAATVAVQGYPYAAAGKIDIFNDYNAPAASYPYYWLGNNDAVITTANWPDLVAYLRAVPLRYGVAVGNINATDVTVTSSNTGVITYAAATESHVQATKILHGLTRFGASKMTLTVPVGGLGGVTAGTWYVTAVDTAARTLTITGSGWSDGTTGSLSVDCKSYPFRVGDTEASPTTKARIYKQTGQTDLTYSADTTYNGVALAITPSSGTLSVRRSVFIPYVVNGTLRLKFNFDLELGAPLTSVTLSIPGVTFKDYATSNGQSVAAQLLNKGVDWVALKLCACKPNTGDIDIGSTANWNVCFVSGDVEVDAITWANAEPLPWNFSRDANGQYSYMWAKTYIP